MTELGHVQQVAGPWFEDLEVGTRFDDAPGLTFTDGLAACHQGVLADRLRLALDHHLSVDVLRGDPRPMVHPGLVCDVAIGQSTLATQRVIANLYYRGLVLHRLPRIGDTLRTSTEVVALKQNSPRPDRAPSGLAVLRVQALDQQGRRVLDFHRCAMLPLRDADVRTDRRDDVAAVGQDAPDYAAVLSEINLAAYRAQVPGPHSEELAAGMAWEVAGGDVVSSAPELARLTLNLATAHHDARSAGGRRLVYGGHTIGIAASHLVRALPSVVTIAGWRSCDHLAPVYEGDVLTSRIEIEGLELLADGGALTGVRVLVDAWAESGSRAVLDWRLVCVTA